MDKQQASKELAALVSKFEEALNEAIIFATEHELRFHISPCYGAGATFDGAEVDGKDEWDNEHYGWFASSQSC